MKKYISVLLALLFFNANAQFQDEILQRYNTIFDSHTIDLDANGYLDVVTVSADGVLSYWLNSASGFSNEVIVDETFLSFKSIDVVDLDGDNNLDFLIGENNSVSAYYNDGNGNYTNEYINGNALLSNAVAGDFNSDGLMDFITSNRASNGQLRYFKKHSSGLFFDIFPIATATVQTDDMLINDFDNDGDLDIIVAIESGFWSSDHVLIFYNDGLGNFTQLNTGFNLPAKNPQVIDYNNDGLKDIFISRGNCCSGVLIQDNVGNFSYTELTRASGMEKSYYTDADGDGDGDIIFIFGGQNANIFTGAPYIPPSIGVWENINGAYTAFSVENIDGGKLISAHDFNNDGIKDWFVTGDFSFGPRIYTKTAPQTYTPTGLKETFASSIKDSADINNDSFIDLLVVSDLQKTVKLLINDTNGNLIPTTLVEGIEDLDEARFSDIDNDGDLDIIFNSDASSSVPGTGIYKLVNDGANNFQQSFINSNFIREFLMTDIDSDGYDDIITISTSNNDIVVWVYYNDGTGGFSSKMVFVTVPLDSITYSGTVNLISYEDLDLDGLRDFDLGVEFYLKGDGTGGFNAIQLPVKGKMVDFDNDGDFDVVYSDLNASSWTLSWFENSSGTFTENIIDSNYRGPNIEVKDFDGDGDKDIISIPDSDFLSEGVAFWTNNGGMAFQKSIINTDIKSGELFATDVDADLDWDVIISDRRIGFFNFKNTSDIPVVLNIDDFVLDNLKIYPNPTTDFINIKTNEPITTAELYNLHGQKVNASFSNNTVDVQNIASGIYFLKLKTSKGEISKKIIKN